MIPGTSMKSTTNREDAVNERNTGAARQSRKCFRFDRTAWQFSRRKNDLFRQFGDVCLGCPVLASSVIRGSFIESESDALCPKASKEGYLRIYPRLDLISALTGESTFQFGPWRPCGMIYSLAYRSGFFLSSRSYSYRRWVA